MAILSTVADSNPFSAAAIVHPAMIQPDEAPKLKVPFAFLASKDEDEGEVNEFKSKLAVPHLVERYSEQIHGWMAARSDLSDDGVKKAYEKGYKQLIHFFGEHL